MGVVSAKVGVVKQVCPPPPSPSQKLILYKTLLVIQLNFNYIVYTHSSWQLGRPAQQHLQLLATPPQLWHVPPTLMVS